MLSSISWQAYEYIHEPKTSDWFWAVSVIAISIAGASIIFGNVIFAILIMVASGALIIHAHKEPRLVDFELNEKGIKIDNTFFPYKTLDSFVIETHQTEIGTFAKILIKSKKTLMPLIVISIAETHPEDVKEYLSIFLPEGEFHEGLGEKLMEWLGF